MSSFEEYRSSVKSMYSSGHLLDIFNELITTEAGYVRTLKSGLDNYATALLDDKRLPATLQGQRYYIFGLIEHIYKFHSSELYPALQKCENVREISETFRRFTDQNRFYLYVMFAINKSQSFKLVTENREFFSNRQNEVNDRLGVNSFLMQPIQRLPKYKLLLDETIKELMKSEHNITNEMKLAMGACCIAYKSLIKVIEAANGAITFSNVIFDGMNNAVNLSQQGIFITVDTFEIKDYKTKRKYHGRVFLFEKAIIYTEFSNDKCVENDRMMYYRGMFVDNTMGLRRNVADPKRQFKLYVMKAGNQEVRFTIRNPDSTVDYWCNKIEIVLMRYFEEEKRKSIRMSMQRRKQTMEMNSMLLD